MKLAFITSLFLIIVPIAFNVTFFMLQKAFDYPDILRQPTDKILRRFQKGGPSLRRLWYAFTFSTILFIPVPVLIQELLPRNAPWILSVATALGVLAGLIQALGLIRWPFLVPDLAEMYTDRKATKATRDSVAVTFRAFHEYAGVAIGEHLGYLLTSGWTILLSITLLQMDLFRPVSAWTSAGWLGLSGIIPALGIFMGVFEQTGFKAAGLINAISYILWSLWLIAFGVILLFALI